MTEPNKTRPLHSTLGPLLVSAWLLGAGGCAQLSFPELPPGLIAKPSSTAQAADEATTADDAAVADTVDPTAPELLEAPEKPTPGKLFEWEGDGRSLTRIVIDTNEQTAHFYAGEERVGWTTIASGVAKHPTPRGQFAILEKVRDKRSNLYGKIVGRNGKVIRGNAHGKDKVPPGARFVGASMPHFMRLTYDGIGMHAGPIPRPGQPASHGCIRMPPQMASAVFEHVSSGTAVTVIGNGPDYGNYAERIARQQAEERARRAAAAAAAEGTALDALDAEIDVLNAAESDSTSGDAPSTSDTAAADDNAADVSNATAAAAPPAGAQGGDERPTTGSTEAGDDAGRAEAPAATTSPVPVEGDTESSARRGLPAVDDS